MLGEVSNSRAAQKWESSVEGLGCVHLRLVGGLRHTIFRALSDALYSVANGHDLDPLRSSPIVPNDKWWGMITYCVEHGHDFETLYEED